MTDHDYEPTLGELGRAVRRVEAAVERLSGQMTVMLGPVGELRVHVENAKTDINEQWTFVRTLEKRVNSIELRAAAVAGGVSAIAFLVKFLLGK